jgi:hypothetical protein
MTAKAEVAASQRAPAVSLSHARLLAQCDHGHLQWHAVGRERVLLTGFAQPCQAPLQK